METESKPVWPVVQNRGDLAARDQQVVTAVGRYRSIAAPRKGAPPVGAITDRAVIVMSDGTEVFLEPNDAPGAKRDPAERLRFEGEFVRVSGLAHRIMPAKGQGLVAPCIGDIQSIVKQG